MPWNWLNISTKIALKTLLFSMNIAQTNIVMTNSWFKFSLEDKF